MEFRFFGHSGTGHTRKLIVKSEKVLECDSGKRFRLFCNLNTLFGFDCLVKSLVVSSAEHKASCKLVNDYNLAVFYYIVNITLHNTVSTDSLRNMMCYFDIRCIIEVFDTEVSFRLFNTAWSKGCGPCLFVYNIVAVIVYILIGSLVVHFLDLDHFKRQRKGVCF